MDRKEKKISEISKKSVQSASQVKIQELENKIQELTRGWQRTQADFENYRKRMEGLKTEWIASANSDLILKLLPLLDNFRRSSLHLPKELEKNNWAIGIKQIEKQFEDILTREGVVKIATKPGDQFDHNLHEAISYEKNNKFKQNQVIDIVETGYKLGDKVLKPVKVRVSKGLDKM